MNVLVIILATVLGGAATGQDREMRAGRSCYADGDYRKAAAHFEMALKNAPDDAALQYWAGRTYEVLADIAFPFDHKYRSKARRHLTTAVELAPSQAEYRQELFYFLAGSGRSLREAAAMLPEDGQSPEHATMRRELERARRSNSSAEGRLGSIFLAVPRLTYRAADLPVSSIAGIR